MAAQDAAWRAATAERTEDSGLLSAEQTSLLIDLYELAMASSHLRRDMNETAVFELFVRRLPAEREWLLVAGLGPALRLLTDMRFGEDELRFLEQIGFEAPLLRYLEKFRFSGEIDAMAEGTVAFAGEPLVRVTGPRIEGQLLETLLLNQINLQTTIATTAARIVLAAGGGEAGARERVIDLSPRRDRGVEAAMKVARAAAIAGVVGTSNVAAAIDSWGIGTELGTSRDAPALGGVYKLVADATGGTPGWRAPWKRSPDRSTVPGPKQVFRSYRDGVMAGDLIAEVSELQPGEALLERFVEAGELVRREPLAALTQRAQRGLASLPADLRTLDAPTPRPYPVTYSERLHRR
jgi:nicotinic acid phosphoribosyltransferase